MNNLFCIVLLFYDYILTFPLEVRYIWHKRINVTKILFVLNRYSSLISQCNNILLYLVNPITNIVRADFLIIFDYLLSLAGVSTAHENELPAINVIM